MKQVQQPLPACCMDLEIQLIDLLFPERLPAAGLEFVKAHGLDQVPLGQLQLAATDLGNGSVHIKHRCAQLGDDGLCQIYANRPEICRQFDCHQRSDCECKGHGLIRSDSIS